MSNEEFAALKADEIIGERLSLAQRVALQGLILATSFAQGSVELTPEKIRAVAHRPYHPVTKLEKLLAFADVSSGVLEFSISDRANAALIYEAGPSAAPHSFDHYLGSLLDFLEEVKRKLADVENLLDSKSAQTTPMK